jgi:hypothetical protein
VRAYAVTVGRGLPVGAPVVAGPVEVAETGRVGIALYEQAGLLILQSRRPRVGGVILDLADLDDRALALLRRFVDAGGG